MTTVGAEPQIAEHAHVVSLEGVSGRLRIHVGENPIAVLEVRDGEVDLRRGEGDGDADAVITCDSEATMAEIGRGELNPVVASLQNRLGLAGNLMLAIKVLLGLRGNRLARTEPGKAES